MKIPITMLVLFTVVIISHSTVVAETSKNSLGKNRDPERYDGKTECRLCFRGKPASNCCFFAVLESGFLTKSSASDQDKFPQDMYPQDKFPPEWVLTNDFGLMMMLGSVHAIGASFFILSTDECSRFGVRSRYRRWLSKDVSLDLTAGIIFGGDESWGFHNDKGLISSVSIGIADLISFDFMYERIGYGRTYTDYSSWDNPTVINTYRNTSSVYVGISGRSYFAPIAPVIFIIWYCAAASSFYGVF